MTLSVLRISRDVAEAWQYMPQVLQRIEKFCLLMDLESDPQDVVGLVRSLFTFGDPRLGLWIGVQDDRVVAHVLATPEPWGENKAYRYVLIRQAWVDPGIDARAEAKAVFDNCRAWALSLGLKRLVALTHRDAEAMLRRWSFKLYKVLLQQEV